MLKVKQTVLIFIRSLSEVSASNFRLVLCSFANCELRSMILVDRRSVLCLLVYVWRALVFSNSCFADTDQFFSNVNNLSILQCDWVGLPQFELPRQYSSQT